jgi:site-specific DNA-methyltransferase (adenine-specific)
VTVRVEHGDCLEIIPQFADEGVVVDAVVTDPPYHLQARVSRFGKKGSAPPKHGRDGAMGRLSRGFMGQKWDGGDVAFRPETWVTVGSILRPGGIMLVFGGSRTYQRMACAIEDAGFVVQDALLWLYGTGFPKRRDQLKPAYEQICFAYKPGGARTVQVDECRIPGAPEATRYDPTVHSHDGWRFTDTGAQTYARAAGRDEAPAGRWPANVCHDGSDEVLALFPQSDHARGNKSRTRSGVGMFHTAPATQDIFAGDTGSTARFFYCAKANKHDRAGSKHPTVKPIALMEWLVRLVTPPDGLVLDMFAGTGVTGQAAAQSGRNAILIERELLYMADIYRRLGMWVEL